MSEEEYAAQTLGQILSANSATLSVLGGQIGMAHVAGRISDATALFLIERVEEHKAKAALDARNTRLASFLPSVHGVAPVVTGGERLRRRRKHAYLAKVSAIPASLAYLFTPGQQAVLAIVGRICRTTGLCDYSVEWIAKVANVCERTVQTTLMLGKRRRLFAVEYRRRATNVVRVVHPDWLRWWNQTPLSETDSSEEQNHSLKGAASMHLEDGEGDEADDPPARPTRLNVPPALSKEFREPTKLKDLLWRLFPPDWPDRNAAGAAVFGRKKRLW